MCRLADFALIRQGVCLLGVMVESASRGWLTQRRSRVFALPPTTSTFLSPGVSSYRALSSWFCVVTHKLKIFIRLLDNASR